MSFYKVLFLPVLSACLITLPMAMLTAKSSYADASINVQIGQNLSHRQGLSGTQHRHQPGLSGTRHQHRHQPGLSGSQYQHRPSTGISGHRSFGVDPRLNHQRYPHYRPHYRHYDTSRDRHRPSLYINRGSSISLVAPVIYSQRYETLAPTKSYSTNRPSTAKPIGNIAHFANIDGWEALSRYEANDAVNAFKAQSSKDPNASLPKVGFALATALQGEPDKAIWALDLALAADTKDLRYFSADSGLQLVVEDLLANYQNTALMTATLLYLKQDYQAAQSALQIALTECGNCTSTRNMQHLIRQRLNS